MFTYFQQLIYLIDTVSACRKEAVCYINNNKIQDGRAWKTSERCDNCIWICMPNSKPILDLKVIWTNIVVCCKIHRITHGPRNIGSVGFLRSDLVHFNGLSYSAVIDDLRLPHSIIIVIMIRTQQIFVWLQEPCLSPILICEQDPTSFLSQSIITLYLTLQIIQFIRVMNRLDSWYWCTYIQCHTISFPHFSIGEKQIVRQIAKNEDCK